MSLDLTPGGVIKFAGDPHLSEEQSTGRVIALDPPHHLAFTWGGDELRFDLEPVDGHRTRFTLTNVLTARDTAARNAAGWDVCLTALTAHATSRPAKETHTGPTPSWEKLYGAYVDAGLPSGAPVPGKE